MTSCLTKVLHACVIGIVVANRVSKVDSRLEVHGIGAIGASQSVTKSDSHLEVDGENVSYAELIEAFHTNLSATSWPYDAADTATMEEVLETVNFGQTSDICQWKWEPTTAKWIFPFTEKSAQPTHTRALALHMLHRHGMGPLAASKHQDEFKQFFDTMDRTGSPSINDFVIALENFPLIDDVFKKLSGMTLSGLRNVHSFDHDFSTERNAGAGCNHGSNAEKCMLQASFSEPTHKFMEEYGFTEDTASALWAGKQKYTDRLWRASSPQERQETLYGDRLKLWAYEEADFFRLHSALAAVVRMWTFAPLANFQGVLSGCAKAKRLQGVTDRVHRVLAFGLDISRRKHRENVITEKTVDEVIKAVSRSLQRSGHGREEDLAVERWYAKEGSKESLIGCLEEHGAFEKVFVD